MIKVLLIEDEAPARKKLKSYIEKTGRSIEIVQELETVEETLFFFKNNKIDIDLIFSDIELRDGNVFEVYSLFTINCPIIFTTAYNQFWMDAFETNGIEYLLKPFSFERFYKAWIKYDSLKNRFIENDINIIQKLERYYQKKNLETTSKKEFLPIKLAQEIYFLKIIDIAFFRADYGVIYAYDSNDKRHMLNQTSLKEVEDVIDTNMFFKINRSEFVNRKFIKKIARYNKNTVSISLQSQNHILKTSQSKTAAFNVWLGV